MSDIDNETLAGIVDTFGIRTYSVATKYYTSIEKNTLSPGFSGLLLLNRLVWITSGIVILIIVRYSTAILMLKRVIQLLIGLE